MLAFGPACRASPRLTPIEGSIKKAVDHQKVQPQYLFIALAVHQKGRQVQDTHSFSSSTWASCVLLNFFFFSSSTGASYVLLIFSYLQPQFLLSSTISNSRSQYYITALLVAFGFFSFGLIPSLTLFDYVFDDVFGCV
jgi:hypothetical protein